MKNKPFEDFVKEEILQQKAYPALNKNKIEWEPYLRAMYNGVSFSLEDESGKGLLKLFMETTYWHKNSEFIGNLNLFTNIFKPSIMNDFQSALSGYESFKDQKFSPYLILLRLKEGKTWLDMVDDLLLFNDDNQIENFTAFKPENNGLALLLLKKDSSTNKEELGSAQFSMVRERRKKREAVHQSVATHPESKFFLNIDDGLNRIDDALHEEVTAENFCKAMTPYPEFVEPVFAKVIEIMDQLPARNEKSHFAPDQSEALRWILDRLPNPGLMMVFLKIASSADRLEFWNAVEQGSLELKEKVLEGILSERFESVDFFSQNFERIKGLIVQDLGLSSFHESLKKAHVKTDNKYHLKTDETLPVIELELKITLPETSPSPSLKPERF